MKRKIIEIDETLCNGCGACVTGCAEGALEIREGKARVVADHFCDGLGACIGHCPTGALAIIEREAPDFDEEAVTNHLGPNRQMPGHLGCPSARPMTMTPCQSANLPTSQQAAGGSGLCTWPIKLRLVPENAPFLQGARLLVLSDCVPPAFPALHSAFLPGRVALLGCPKFDDAPAHVDKLAAIIRANDIVDITIIQMEVPCCSGMARIISQAVEQSGKAIPVTRVVVSRRGEIVEMRSMDVCAPLAQVG
jgi:Pyruvate/2-oxoacid:ferredoxin oxidoreductase delta subunit